MTTSTNGRPVNRVAKQTANFSEIGWTGLRYSGGLLLEEFRKELMGDRWVKVAREMSENDDVVGASLTAIEMMVRQVDWSVAPVSESPDDMDAAEFLEGCMGDMSHSWEDFIAEVLSMLPYGWEANEIVYKRRQGQRREPGMSSRFTDGKIGIRKLPIRSQDTRDHWEFDEDGGISALVQRDPNTSKLATIPIEKLLLFRASSHKGSPEGKSVLRRAFISWYYKKQIQKIEAIGIERDLAGYPKGYCPPEWFSANATQDQKNALQAFKDIGTNIRRDEQEFVLIPSMFDENGNRLADFELMSTGGARQFDTNDVILRYDRGIAGSMLADFILLGHEQSGSWALSSDKTDLFAVALGSILDSIAAVLNRHLVPRLFRLNGAPERMEFPEFQHGDIEKVDINRFADAVQKLTASGLPLFPDADREAYIYRLLDLPADVVGQEL